MGAMGIMGKIPNSIIQQSISWNPAYAGQELMLLYSNLI